MSGYLPGTRPATSATYADDFVDEKPVEKPDSELPADVFNKMKADLAYLARTGALLAIYVTNDGAAAGATVMYGPEGVDAGDVIATRTGAGLVTVDYSNITTVGSAANGGPMHASTPAALMCTKPASGVLNTYVTTSVGALDADFLLLVY